MSRPLRIEFPGAWYYVTNRGRHGDVVFVDKTDYQTFVDLLKESVALWNVGVSAYCLMSNRYYLLISTPEGNLSRCMRHINGIYTQRFNRFHDFDGPLFRGRFKSILVEQGRYLKHLVKYIHRFPVREGIDKQIDQYAWSSHRGYLSKAKKWDWLDTEYILSLISGTARGRVKAYRAFVDQDDSPEILKIFKMKKYPAILGDKGFIDWVRGKYFTGQFNQQIPEAAILAPDVNRIKSEVCRAYQVDDAALMKSRRGVFNEPRGVAIYLTRILRKDSLDAIGREFSMAGYSSVSSAIVRIKDQMARDKRLPSRVEKIKSSIIAHNAL